MWMFLFARWALVPCLRHHSLPPAHQALRGKFASLLHFMLSHDPTSHPHFRVVYFAEKNVCSADSLWFLFAGFIIARPVRAAAHSTLAGLSG